MNKTKLLEQPPTGRVDTADIEATVVLSGPRSSQGARSSVGEADTQPADPGFDDRFEFICDFAAGGVGKISKARDLSFDRVVAIKSLNGDYAKVPEAVNAFIEECRLNAKLDHPSIVPIYALGRSKDGNWEAAMKLINGSSLNDFIVNIRKNYDHKKVTYLQERHALISRLEYFLKICEVISYCHSLEIVHGDLKPANILMGRFGEVYVMDWGCAQYVGTKPESLSGTPNYLPPEFFTTRTVSFQNDIYALGMILFELGTLMRGKNRCSCVTDPKQDTTCCLVAYPDKYHHYLPKLKIAPRLKAIIMKAVNPEESKRYASVAALAADVRHFIYDEEVEAAPDNCVQKFFRILYHNRIKSMLVAATLLTLLVGGWGYSEYRAMAGEQRRDFEILQRLRMQSYTDILNAGITKKLLQSQAQMLLFADNLIEDMQEQLEVSDHIYDNAEYAPGSKNAPAVAANGYYPRPVTFEYMVRLRSGRTTMKLLGGAQYVRLCKKILNYDLTSRDINVPGNSAAALNNDKNLIHRLQVLWADGTVYSYPGTYEEPGTTAYAKRFKNVKFDPHDKNISWSAPYVGLIGMHRIQCNYPLYKRDGRYLGMARLELRLEKVLSVLLKANSQDPVHELYFIARDGSVVMADGGKLTILPREGALPGKIAAAAIHDLFRQLKDNHMQQLTVPVNGKIHYVTGSKLGTTDAALLQMIDKEKMKHHNHVDLTL